MKVKCIKTSYLYEEEAYCYEKELSNYITIGNIYEVLSNPSSEWVLRIIDDRGLEHDIDKECFIPIRDINLDKLLD